MIYARADTLDRFSDVPLLLWYEVDPLPSGQRIRYSVVFSNEDGGTPADRLMATWGRLTDIEFVYGVELDAAGRVVSERYQGREHRILPFRGRRLGRHPLLWVVTGTTCSPETGKGRHRIAPAPFPFDLASVSREAVMDAHPWTYRVSSEEARREGRVREDAVPGSRDGPGPAALRLPRGLRGREGRGAHVRGGHARRRRPARSGTSRTATSRSTGSSARPTTSPTAASAARSRCRRGPTARTSPACGSAPTRGSPRRARSRSRRAPPPRG